MSITDYIDQLDAEEHEMYDLLISLGQGPVLETITSLVGLKKICKQTRKINSDYPNGIASYISNAKDLIDKSLNEVNPYDGYVPSIPTGKTLNFGTPDFSKCEAIGYKQLKHTGFVLVAGGLGERLGYDNIKVSLNAELSSEWSFMKLYIETILAYQRMTGADMLPLFIMTSDQTDELTKSYLKENSFFGMKQNQITICKQNGVPALSNKDGLFFIENDEIVCKPHGHGDVHILMHLSGTAKKWSEMGINYVIFFQDTNGLAVHAFPALVGTSYLLNLEVNSLCVNRQAKEKVGGICTLSKSDGSCVTINVEYNVLDAMIKTIDPRGDINDAKTGFSPYPGNINILCFDCHAYAKTLEISGGSIPEFVNPKWKEDKSGFKSPTRLECMMQDYPKLLSPTAKVGFTTMERWLCFSAVKNSASNAKIQVQQCGVEESLASGENDIYKLHIQYLIAAGAVVGKNCRVVITPKCGVTAAQITSHFGSGLIIHDNSTLVIDGDIRIEHLELSGSYLYREPRTKVLIRNLVINNMGWDKKEVVEDDLTFSTQTRSRGYYFNKHGTEVRTFSGHFQIVEEY